MDFKSSEYSIVIIIFTPFLVRKLKYTKVQINKWWLYNGQYKTLKSTVLAKFEAIFMKL